MSRFLENPRFNAPETFNFNKAPIGPVKIDPAHWINKKLNCLWLPNKNYQVLRDILSTQHLSREGEALVETLNTRYSRGLSSRAWLSAGNIDRYIRTDNNCFYKGVSSATFFAYFKCNTVSNGYGDGRLLSCDTGSGEGDHNWMIGWTASGSYRARIRTTNQSTATIYAGTISDGDVGLLVGYFDAATSARGVRVYLTDGTTSAGSTSGTGELYIDKNNSVAMFANAGVESNQADANVMYSGTYSGQLSDKQCWSLLRSPYQFLIPK